MLDQLEKRREHMGGVDKLDRKSGALVVLMR